MAQVNKAHSIRTIHLVAKDFHKVEGEIADLALGMDPEDGLIWVCRPEHESGIMAFTPAGIENLKTLIADQKIAKASLLRSSPYGYPATAMPRENAQALAARQVDDHRGVLDWAGGRIVSIHHRFRKHRRWQPLG